MPETPALTRSLLDFIDASPTPFHAVAEARRRLTEHLFTPLDEREAWRFEAGARHVVVRHDSSLVAFALGSQPPAEAGFLLIGAHTDSPNLRLKPRAELARHGCRQLAVEVYGGALLHTWLDRDLSLAGRVFLAGTDEPRLLRVERPLCRVPSLAIHLDREVNEKGLVLHKQNHLPALVGLRRGRGLAQRAAGRRAGVSPQAIAGLGPDAARQRPGLRLGPVRRVRARAASRQPGRLPRRARGPGRRGPGSPGADAGGGPLRPRGGRQPERRGGAARPSWRDCSSGWCARRAARPRTCTGPWPARCSSRRTWPTRVHPNYADLHEPQHAPRLGGGPVIKVNSAQRYATSGATALRFERAARAAGVPTQRFVMRTDLPCGSTIGPITAARLGVATVDVGNPMLSMHSAREMASSVDQGSMVGALAALLAGC